MWRGGGKARRKKAWRGRIGVVKGRLRPQVEPRWAIKPRRGFPQL